jgi:hypothetical protein
MYDYTDIRTVLTVPVQCAGAEDEIDVAVTIQVTIDQEAKQVWVDIVKREDGERVALIDPVFGCAEAWIEKRAEDILRGDI